MTSFVDKGIITEARSKDLYQRVILASAFLCMIIVPFFGALGDRVTPKVLIPIAFTIRGISGYCFIFITTPESYFAVAVILTMIVSTLLEAVVIDKLFVSGLPSRIRGGMVGAFSFFGHFGCLCFTLFGGHLYDRISRNAPFVFLAMMDSLLVVITLVMVCRGKLRKY